MLEIALGLDRVHIFGDISKSQLFEKTDWIIENATTESHKIADRQKVLFLAVIISLAFNGLLAESDQEHTKWWNEDSKRCGIQFPTSVDCT